MLRTIKKEIVIKYIHYQQSFYSNTLENYLLKCPSVVIDILLSLNPVE